MLDGFSGGYTAGPKELVTLLRQRSRPYLFSNSLPPPVVACASKVRPFYMNYCFLSFCHNFYFCDLLIVLLYVNTL